jgi:hypothetical protein
MKSYSSYSSYRAIHAYPASPSPPPSSGPSGSRRFPAPPHRRRAQRGLQRFPSQLSRAPPLRTIHRMKFGDMLIGRGNSFMHTHTHTQNYNRPKNPTEKRRMLNADAGARYFASEKGGAVGGLKVCVRES